MTLFNQIDKFGLIYAKIFLRFDYIYRIECYKKNPLCLLQQTQY